jgi:hypothetical protein
MSAEHWKCEDYDGQAGQLFDDAPYINHKYLFPNVIEIKPIREASGHDETFDHLKCEVIDFPQREDPPNLAA